MRANDAEREGKANLVRIPNQESTDLQMLLLTSQYTDEKVTVWTTGRAKVINDGKARRRLVISSESGRRDLGHRGRKA